MGKETGNARNAGKAPTAAAGGDAAAERRARAAEALRANLKRRKAQARERGTAEPESGKGAAPEPRNPS